MTYYPVFLELRERLCVVIGDGPCLCPKLLDLLAAGARVRFISSSPHQSLSSLAAVRRIEHLPRGYRAGDLGGAFLAIADRSNPDILQELWCEAQRHATPLNVIDDLPHCSFIAPSVTRQGDLVVAVSTSGAAPALAVRVRQRIDKLLGPEYGEFLRLARRLRPALAQRVPELGRRRELWYRLVDSDVLDLIGHGSQRAVLARICEIVGVDLDEATVVTAARRGAPHLHRWQRNQTHHNSTTAS